MKISILATIVMCVVVDPLSAQEANKPDSANEQSNSAEFSGFEPVNEDSKNMTRTSLPSAEGWKTKIPYARMALNSVYAGVAISEPEYFNWCTSPLEVDGKIHLFHCRWPDWMSSWKSTAEIVRYIGDSPEGPFKFAGKVLTNDDLAGTGYISPVNPRLEKVDGKFVVFYTVRPKGAPSSAQRIGMIISDKIEGPWRLVGEKGIVLSPSDDPDHFTYNSKVGVDNPAFIKVGNKYHLYFKFKDGTKTWGGYGVAISDKLEGPYTIAQRCTDNISYLEDAQAFEWNGKYYLLTDDNLGGNCGIFGAQVLWKSDDGLTFKRKDAVISSGTIFDYWDGSQQDRIELMEKEPFTRHECGKFERPAFLFQNGRPTYFYAIGDVNIHAGKTPEVYMLRIKDSE